MSPGPYRAASKAGVFIGMLAFYDIYAKHELLTKESDLKCIAARGTVGSYAINVCCWLFRQDSGKEDTVHFSLRLCEGEWNHYLEWPFSKKITVIVTHLTNSEKDIRLPMKEVSGHYYFRQPGLGACNWAVNSEDVKWKDLELNGFIVNNTLYVNIEFE